MYAQNSMMLLVKNYDNSNFFSLKKKRINQSKSLDSHKVLIKIVETIGNLGPYIIQIKNPKLSPHKKTKHGHKIQTHKQFHLE